MYNTFNPIRAGEPLFSRGEGLRPVHGDATTITGDIDCHAGERTAGRDRGPGPAAGTGRGDHRGLGAAHQLPISR